MMTLDGRNLVEKKTSFGIGNSDNALEEKFQHIKVSELGFYKGCGDCPFCEAEEGYAPCKNARFILFQGAEENLMLLIKYGRREFVKDFIMSLAKSGYDVSDLAQKYLENISEEWAHEKETLAEDMYEYSYMWGCQDPTWEYQDEDLLRIKRKLRRKFKLILESSGLYTQKIRELFISTGTETLSDIKKRISRKGILYY